MRTPIPTVGGAYTHDTLPFDAQTCVNLFPESGNPLTKDKGILRRASGTVLFITVAGSGAIRALYKSSTGRMFAVRGNKLVEIFSGATQLLIGSLTSNSGPVGMTDNGTQMALSDGSQLWSIVLATNAMATVTDPNSVAPTNTPQVVFIDGYIFGFNPNDTTLGQFRHSELNDLDTWLAIDLYRADASPDKLVSMVANRAELWVLGTDSYDVFYNAKGDNSSPANPTWTRVPGGFNNIGCAARFSVVSMLGSVFWLGTSKEGKSVVYMSTGYQATPVSTKAITSEINKISSISEAEAFTTQRDGHYFYWLTFPNGNKTFVYDLTENEWHTRAKLTPSTGEQARHRASSHVVFNNTSYVGDFQNGNIYELSKTAYDDNGDPQLCERTFPYIEASKQRISCPWIQFDILTGDGLIETATTLSGTINTTAGLKSVTDTYTSLSGTITTDLTKAVVGAGTAFTTELTVGETIRWTDDVSREQHGTIATITDATNLTLTTLSTSISTGVATVSYTTRFTTQLSVSQEIRWIDNAGGDNVGAVASIESDWAFTLLDNAPTISTAVACRAIDSDGTDPKVKMRYSDNGGRIYGNWRQKGTGKRGEYDTRVIFRLLGQFRDRVFQLHYSEPTPYAIMDSTIAELNSGYN